MDSTTVLLVALAALACIVTGADPPQPQYRDLFLPVMDECKECVGATDEDVEIGLNRGVLNTPTLKCLQYCMYHKIGAINGVVLNEPAADKAYIQIHGGSADEARKKVDACYQTTKSKSETDACCFSADLQECFSKAKNTE